MKSLWKYIDEKAWSIEIKYHAAYLILELLFGLVGFGLWLVVRLWTLSTWDWMLCFIGYPIIISRFVVFFYSCNHDFHHGSFHFHFFAE